MRKCDNCDKIDCKCKECLKTKCLPKDCSLPFVMVSSCSNFTDWVIKLKKSKGESFYRNTSYIDKNKNKI